ncbi:na+/H+ antiporter family protein, partial [Vibrio parahaemolyticus VP2007-007]
YQVAWRASWRKRTMSLLVAQQACWIFSRAWYKAFCLTARKYCC